MLLEQTDRTDRLVEVTGDLSNLFVGLGDCPVQTERRGPHPVGVQHRERGGVQARRDRGRDGDRHARALRVRGQLGEVRALQAVTAGQDQDRGRPAGARELVDDRFALFGGELVRCGLALRDRPAVHARQRAGLGRLPEDQAGHPIEGHGRASTPFGECFRRGCSVRHHSQCGIGRHLAGRPGLPTLVRSTASSPGHPMTARPRIQEK